MNTYNKIAEYMTEKGLTSADITYEYYLNSIVEVPSSELLTKVVVYIKE